MTKEELEELRELEELELLEKKYGKPKGKSLGETALSKVSDLGESALSAAESFGETALPALKAGTIGLGQGITFGGLDELSGAAAAVGDITTGQSKGRNLADLYREYQQLAQAKIEEEKQKSPIAFEVGNVAGSIVPGFATAGMGAGASAVARGASLGSRLGSAAKQGAAFGALGGALSSKEGGLTSVEEAQKLAADVAGGAAMGGVLGAGTQAVLGEALPAAAGKAKELVKKTIKDKPLFRQMSIAKEMGEEGVNIGSDATRTGAFGKVEGLVERDVKAAQDVTNKLFKVDEELGAEVGSALAAAERSGAKIPLSQSLKDEIEDFATSISPTNILTPSQSKDLLMVASNLDDVTPTKAKIFVDKLDEITDNLSGDNSQVGRSVFKLVGDLKKKLRSEMKEALPEYKAASDRFENFRSTVMEPVVSGKRPGDISDLYLGNLKNKEQAVFDASLKMIQGGTKPGTARQEDQLRLMNLLRGLRETEQKVPETATKVQKAFGKPATGIEEELVKKADESAMLQQAWGINPQESVGTSLRRGGLDLSGTGRGIAMSGANIAGRVIRSGKRALETKPATFTRRLVDAPSEKLEQYAQKLIQSGDKGSVSTGEFLLKALQEKNNVMKNAALFKIMQNPNMRLLISGDDLTEGNEE